MTIEFIASSNLPTKFGLFKIYGFLDNKDQKEHLALTFGDVSGVDVLVRVHSECLTGDAFYSRKCDCGEQFERAMQIISSEGRGVILYLRQEGRGIGILNKIRAYHLQDQGFDTVEANILLGFKEDCRTYDMVPFMLKHLNIESIILLTNNPSKITNLESLDVQISKRMPIEIKSNKFNEDYLKTKALKMSHLFKQG